MNSIVVESFINCETHRYAFWTEYGSSINYWKMPLKYDIRTVGHLPESSERIAWFDRKDNQYVSLSSLNSSPNKRIALISSATR